MKVKNKKSQVTVFVIIAIVIVAILVAIFYPQLKQLIIPPTPEQLVPRACVEEIVKKNIAEIMLHGSSLNPQLFFRYNNISVEYLCYTSEWYKTCQMQKPLLKQNIEAEIQRVSQASIGKCIDQMVSTLQSRGYEVKLTGSKNAIINIIPNKVLVQFNITMALDDGNQKSVIASNKFRTDITSGSYDLIMIASSIQNFEARFGDSEVTSYMTFYPNLKAEKYRQSDGTKVYILTNRDSEEKLQFATRSLAFPPGYAIPITSTFD